MSDDFVVRRVRKRVDEMSKATGYPLTPEQEHRVLKQTHPARGRVLDMMGRYHGIFRVGLFERIPFIGDRWFRRRVEAAIKAKLGPGVTEVRLSVGYNDDAGKAG